MKLALKKASTDVTVYVFIQDSSKTDGSGLTGLVYNSASLVASQVRPLTARVAITLATQTVTGAHSDGGFVEVDATNMPGVYRLDLPDAVCVTGVDSALVMLEGATNMAPIVLEIQLTDFDLNDASPEVTLASETHTGAIVPSVTTVTGNVDGSVGSLGTTAKANVNTEVADVLKTDTISELSGDPGATPTIEDALMLLYMALRNANTATATARKIMNNAGTAILTGTMSDDSTTFDQGKLV